MEIMVVRGMFDRRRDPRDEATRQDRSASYSSAGDSPATAQAAFRRGGRRRLLAACGGALLALLLLIVLGPSEQAVKDRFELTGKRGPLLLMNEVSVTDAKDKKVQLPRHFRELPPPPAPAALEPPAPQGTMSPLPSARPTPAPVPDEAILSDPDLDLVDLVELNSPVQSLENPWFKLVRLVRPEYPAMVDEIWRRQPLVTVEAAHYVDEQGQVTAAYIVRCDGGPEFEAAVLKALQLWVYQPLDPSGRAPAGFWKPTIWRFRSPYAQR